MEQAFEQAKNALRFYELATCAKMNLSKSEVVPFVMEEIPVWLRNTGCKICLPAKVQQYLGAPFGCGFLVS